MHLLASWFLLAPRLTQSVISVAAGAALFALSYAPPARRRTGALAVLAALLLGMVFVRLHLMAPEGDYGTYIEDPQHFELYMNVSGPVQLQSHLGSTINGLFYRALGRGPDAMVPAFELYATFASVLYIAAAAAVGFVERWSREAVRYLALVAVAPPVLLFFGYRELGYEPLAPCVLAFPLLVTGIERRSAWRVRAAGALLGLAAALHGYALFALLTGILLGALLAGPLADRARVAFDVAAYGIAVYAMWFPVYLILEKFSIDPGHAGDLAFRPWFHTKLAEHRYDHPIFSQTGGKEVLLMLLVGGPILYLPALLMRARWAALLATVPILFFYVKFWPVQGLGDDTDLAVGTFGALYLLAWLVAQRDRSARLGGALLVLMHPVFWFIASYRFVVGQQY